tara:strand:- start:567 stop:764 length:198 start_codon:yes stop_codon:yes gene_type:complete
MIKSRLGATGDIEMVLDAAEQMNAESDWSLTWLRDIVRNYLTWLVENETSDKDCAKFNKQMSVPG